jgi:hypothetical protein
MARTCQSHGSSFGLKPRLDVYGWSDRIWPAQPFLPTVAIAAGYRSLVGVIP